jgi:hypothetical protein
MHRVAILCIAVALVGCAPKSPSAIERGKITYYDRNGDGRVDFEYHDLGGGDMDWALADRNYDGFYDIRLRYGIVLGIDRVHIGVPSGVSITRKKIPVQITDYGQSAPIPQP